MRLGLRMAGRESTRRRSSKARNNITAANAPTTSGISSPWPPPWPDDVASRGGRGTGGRRCGTAPAGSVRVDRASCARRIRAEPVTTVVREVTEARATLRPLLVTSVTERVVDTLGPVDEDARRTVRVRGPARTRSSVLDRTEVAGSRTADPPASVVAVDAAAAASVAAASSALPLSFAAR